MKLLFSNERSSALIAACAPVSGVPGSLAAAAPAHAVVGHAAVRGGMGVGTSQIQARWARKQGITVSAYGLEVQDSVTAGKVRGDVRGVPPRGRPV